MNRRVRVTKAAEVDIKEAAAWYGERSSQAALGFLESVQETVARIGQNPMQYQQVLEDAHRANLATYPYGLWYVPQRKGALVFACLHNRRSSTAVTVRTILRKVQL